MNNQAILKQAERLLWSIQWIMGHNTRGKERDNQVMSLLSDLRTLLESQIDPE